MARPKKYTDNKIEEYRLKLEAYIKETKIPIVAEFCYLNDIRKERVYEFGRDNEKFSHSLKKCIEKKESQIEKLALIGVINSTMAIFSLKQLGWKDRQEIEDLSAGENLKKIVNAIKGISDEV